LSGEIPSNSLDLIKNKIQKVDYLSIATNESNSYEPKNKPLKSSVSDHKIKSVKADSELRISENEFDKKIHLNEHKEYDVDSLKSGFKKSDQSIQTEEIELDIIFLKDFAERKYKKEKNNLLLEPNELDKYKSDKKRKRELKFEEVDDKFLSAKELNLIPDDKVKQVNKKVENLNKLKVYSNENLYKIIHELIKKGSSLENLKKNSNEYICSKTYESKGNLKKEKDLNTDITKDHKLNDFLNGNKSKELDGKKIGLLNKDFTKVDENDLKLEISSSFESTNDKSVTILAKDLKNTKENINENKKFCNKNKRSNVISAVASYAIYGTIGTLASYAFYHFMNKM
jgi:hypothetical protein